MTLTAANKRSILQIFPDLFFNFEPSLIFFLFFIYNSKKTLRDTKTLIPPRPHFRSTFAADFPTKIPSGRLHWKI